MRYISHYRWKLGRETRGVAPNASTAQYRTISKRPEKGLPILVSDGHVIVRENWGGKPHRKAANLGKVLNVIPTPWKDGPAARSIQYVAISWFSKYAQETSSTPSIAKCRRLIQDREWRQFPLDPNEREKFDVPRDPPPPPLRMNAETIATNPTAAQ